MLPAEDPRPGHGLALFVQHSAHQGDAAPQDLRVDIYPLDVTLDMWAAAHGSVMLEFAGPGIFDDRPDVRFTARMRNTLDSFRPRR